jgi:DNA-binding NarL/FixJ family response regulator
MFGDILIVYDHEVVRRGHRSLLSSNPEWRISGEAADGVEGIEKARASPWRFLQTSKDSLAKWNW